MIVRGFGENFIELEPASKVETARLIWACDQYMPLSAVCKISVTIILEDLDNVLVTNDTESNEPGHESDVQRELF
jgi:hypothetical protein